MGSALEFLKSGFKMSHILGQKANLTNLKKLKLYRVCSLTIWNHTKHQNRSL